MCCVWRLVERRGCVRAPRLCTPHPAGTYSKLHSVSHSSDTDLHRAVTRMSEAETSAAGAAAPLVRAHSSSISSPRQTAKSVSGSSSSSRMRARSITGSNAQQHTGISGRVSSTGNLTALSSTAAAGTEAAGETQSYGRRSGASLLAGSPISRLKRSMTYSSANDEQLQAARAASAKARASPSSSREVPLTSPAASRSRSRAKSAVERVPTLSCESVSWPYLL